MDDFGSKAMLLLIGALIGYIVGLWKYRYERASTRRWQWYEAFFEVTQEAASLMFELVQRHKTYAAHAEAISIQGGSVPDSAWKNFDLAGEELTHALDMLGDVVPRMNSIGAHRAIYAAPRFAQKLSDLEATSRTLPYPPRSSLVCSRDSESEVNLHAIARRNQEAAEIWEMHCQLRNVVLSRAAVEGRDHLFGHEFGEREYRARLAAQADELWERFETRRREYRVTHM